MERVGFVVADPNLGIEIYLTPSELTARYKGTISEHTLANWRSKGEGPAYLKLGGKVVYKLSDVLRWEITRRIGS